MAIIRYRSGECCELTGLYEIVGHYGEATGIPPKWIDKGDLFGPLEADVDAGPLWYVRLHIAAEQAEAA